MRKIIIMLSFIFGSCGLDPKGDEKVEYRDYPPQPTPAPGPSPEPGGFSKVRKIMEESCGFNGCHSSQASFITTEAGLRASSAQTRILNGSMPPNYAQNYYLWEDGARKKTILDFLNRVSD